MPAPCATTPCRHADLFSLFRGYTPYNISANRTQQLQFLSNITTNILGLANELALGGHKTFVIATLPALYLTPHALIEPPYGAFLPANEAIVNAEIRAGVKSLKKAHPKAKVLLWDLERLYKRVGEWDMEHLWRVGGTWPQESGWDLERLYKRVGE
jgi:hypothetical protein